ncbi:MULTISPECIES: hypothetical protein [unclassified Gemella]|uniref:hypothetical protein n=1 Tax=unclassified Gemella TaxID=2624949 RepID=UPI001C051EB4|nr:MULTISPECIES: hypothetical protein [unclassified Gemella]MBU0278787.1 hypothetical protein [Gemella sp. zg-1178]QWQ38725.1 hypothetical protein KMP11_07220 [Gemella sp. zg-570]
MKKTKLDKNILLGGIVLDHEKYQVVHMNLKKGNQTDNYSNNRNILIFNVSGKISVAKEDSVEILNEFEMLEIPKDTMHIITCIDDAQVVIFKI